MKYEKNIPVVHCFNAGYVIPAAVSFLSMLEHANRKWHYDLYVLHSDLCEEDTETLSNLVNRFDNATLTFRKIGNECDRLYNALDDAGRRHYSKEMFLKLMLPDIFPQYDKIIVTDVDVVWEGDVAEYFDSFNSDSNYYLAGVSASKVKCASASVLTKENVGEFSAEERLCIADGVGAGFMMLNLAALRRDGVVAKLSRFASDNAKRLRNPEQDTFNIVCAGRIQVMPPRMMVCTYLYDQTTEAERESNAPLIANPIQIHYASQVKPWNTPSSAKADLWYRWLLETPYFYKAMAKFNPPQEKTKYWLAACGLPIVRVKQKPMVSATYSLWGIVPLKRRR